jgi:hypothetical protein
LLSSHKQSFFVANLFKLIFSASVQSYDEEMTTHNVSNI